MTPNHDPLRGRKITAQRLSDALTGIDLPSQTYVDGAGRINVLLSYAEAERLIDFLKAAK